MAMSVDAEKDAGKDAIGYVRLWPLVRKTVMVDGVFYDRSTYERHRLRLDKIGRAFAEPEPVTLDTSRLPGRSLDVRLSDGREIYIANRAVGPHANAGLYLGNTPEGYRWTLINDEMIDGARTLILEKSA